MGNASDDDLSESPLSDAPSNLKLNPFFCPPALKFLDMSNSYVGFGGLESSSEPSSPLSSLKTIPLGTFCWKEVFVLGGALKVDSSWERSMLRPVREPKVFWEAAWIWVSKVRGVREVFKNLSESSSSLSSSFYSSNPSFSSLL